MLDYIQLSEYLNWITDSLPVIKEVSSLTEVELLTSYAYVTHHDIIRISTLISDYYICRSVQDHSKFIGTKL